MTSNLDCTDLRPIPKECETWHHVKTQCDYQIVGLTSDVPYRGSAPYTNFNVRREDDPERHYEIRFYEDSGSLYLFCEESIFIHERFVAYVNTHKDDKPWVRSLKDFMGVADDGQYRFVKVE